MGKDIVRNTVIDPSTGEVISEKSYVHYDGFNDKGYKYRFRTSGIIKIYPDSIPVTLSADAFLLLYMLAEIANEDNALVYRIKRKSRFSSIIYKPYDRDELRKKTKWKYGVHKFNRCWSELRKHCVKQVKYYQYKTWIINPAVVSKCPQIPPWLYDEFSLYLNPYMSKRAITKMKNLVKELDE